MFRVKECKVSAENSFVYLVHSFKQTTCVDGRLKVQITDSQASLMYMFLVQPRVRSFQYLYHDNNNFWQDQYWSLKSSPGLNITYTNFRFNDINTPDQTHVIHCVLSMSLIPNPLAFDNCDCYNQEACSKF